jgi:hypothetical protein
MKEPIMTKKEFYAQVESLLAERANDKIHALDLGRRFKQLCRDWLEDHESLPEEFEGFDYYYSLMQRSREIKEKLQ